MSNLTASTELAQAIAHFQDALNATLSHMEQSPVALTPFYACHTDMIAKLSFNTALPMYQFERFVKVAIAHIAGNVKLSDRVRDMSADLDCDCIFFQV